MFGLGFSEIIIIFLVAFLILGPKEFPKMAKMVLKVLNDIKSSFQDVKKEIDHVEKKMEEQIEKTKESLISSDEKK